MPDNEQFWKEIMGDKWKEDYFAENKDIEDELDRALEGKELGWELADDEFTVEYLDAVTSGKSAAQPKAYGSAEPILHELFPGEEAPAEKPQMPEPAEDTVKTEPVHVEYLSFEKTEEPEPEWKPVETDETEEVDEKTLLFRELGPRPITPPTPEREWRARETVRPKEKYPAAEKKPIVTVNRRRKEQPLPEEIAGPANFEVDFDYEEEYQDVNEKPIKRGRRKRTGCLGGILYFIFILAISIVLACLGWMAATDVLGLGDGDEVVEITLPKSIFSEVEREKEDENGEPVMKTVTVADMDYVAEVLYEKDLIEYKWIFKLFCKLAKGDEKVAAGTYQVNKNYDYRALLSGMTATGGTKVEIDITVPEGYTVAQTIKLLADNGVCDEAELWDVVANNDFEYPFLSKDTLGDKYRLEGYLFPDTYKFYIGDNPTRVIKKFLSNFNNKWTEEFDAQAEELGYTREEILIMASMIEKEAGIDAERSIIASVIYNRLETDKTSKLLQIDATIVYAMGRDGVSGGINTEYDSPYNTYENQGLPPGPIANPGIASIKAALYPENTKYYYYALNKEGSHEFFKDYESHSAFVQSDEYGG